MNEKIKPVAAQEAVAVVSAETYNSDGTSDIIKPALPIGTKLYAAPAAAAPVIDPSRLGAAMRAFDDAGGHAISYAPAWMRKALEAASAPAAPGIDLMRRIRQHLDRAASVNGDMQAGALLAELDGSPCATLEELQQRMADASPKGGSKAGQIPDTDGVREILLNHYLASPEKWAECAQAEIDAIRKQATSAEVGA